MKPWCVTIQRKAIEQYFNLELFIMLYKVFLTFNSADEALVDSVCRAAKMILTSNWELNLGA